MATKLQDYQAKRKELQITNPNATMLDAKSALSPSPITNAPVAWVAPAITNPTPVAPTAPVSVHDNPTYQSNTTEQYNQWVMAQNKAKAAARADTSQANPPAIIQQAQNKPLNAEEQAINNQFWWNIQSNGINDRQPLNQAITDAKTWNITAFDKIPWNIENKWSVIPPPVTIGDMYNNLVNKIDVTPEQKALPTFKIAQNRFNKANMFSSMTPAELSTEMKSAKLVEWSPAWEDLKVMNPELVRSTKALNTANGIKHEIFTYINNPDGTKVKQNNLEQSFVSDYNDNYSDIVKILTDIYKPDTAAEARAKIYTPEVRQAEEKATAIELEMNKISDIKDWIEKDLEKEYAWTWATGSRIALEKQYRNEQLTNQYNSLLKNYTTYANKANNLITQNTDLYKSEQEGKKALSTALAWVALKDYGMQAEADFARKEAIKNINDPATAINNVMEEYKKLGIPFTSTLQSRLQEFANSGKSLPDYLTEMTQNIQASPAYQTYQKLQEWQMSDMQKVAANQNFEMKKMGMEQDFQLTLAKAKQTTDNKWTKLDDWLYTNDAGQIMTADELKTAKLIDNSYLQKTVWQEWGECGFYASRATGMSSTPWGNSKEARVKAFSDTTPQVWGMAFFWGAWYDPTYWHISIVTGVNQDGTITVKDSNYAGTGKVDERTVPASSVTGYYNNTPLAKWVGGQWTTWGAYSDEQINNLAYLVELQEKNPSEASKQMKEMGYKAQDMANYKAGNMPLTEKQKNSSTEVMDAIKQLTDPAKYEWNDAVWFLAWTPSLSGWDAASATMAIDNLVAKLTLPNLWVLKWPMSDKDIAFIKDASSKLSRNQSDSSFERNLIDAYNLSARRVWLPEIESLAELQWEKKAAGGKKAYSKYE